MEPFYGPGRTHLFVPGPVNIPDPVVRAMNRNNEDYRAPPVPALTRTLLEDVKKIFKTTTGTPFLIPTTGSKFTAHLQKSCSSAWFKSFNSLKHCSMI